MLTRNLFSVRGLIAALLFGLSATAFAARNLPPDVKSGQYQGYNFVQAQIDDAVYRVAPGIRVFNVYNHIVFLQTVPRNTRVFYQIDQRGDLIQMWIAGPDEASKAQASEFSINQ